MDERTGEAFERGEQLTVVGCKLEPGQPAPDFTLEHFDGTVHRKVRLTDSAGTVRLVSVVNSLDTPVCHVQTRRWESLRPQLPEGAHLMTVSMDLPYAQARWHAAECVGHVSLSAHKSEQFGTDYGLLIKEWRLLQRAVFVIGPDNRVIYAEYVADQMREPDYNAALAAVRAQAA